MSDRGTQYTGEKHEVTEKLALRRGRMERRVRLGASSRTRRVLLGGAER